MFGSIISIILNDWIAHILYGNHLEYTPINNFCNRKDTENILKRLEKHMVKYCYYCNNCDFCNTYTIRCAEFKKMGFWTHNKNVKYWDFCDPLYNKQIKNFNIKPLCDLNNF